MRLSELLREVEYDGSYKQDVDIDLVTDDSRLVRPGALFVCVQHRSFDGHSAAKSALMSGAAAVVTQERLGLETELNVSNSRAAYASLCAALYGHPERRLKMIGVTGTNGKTTVSTLIRNIFEQAGIKTLLVGTVCNRIGDEELPSGLTTPKPPELYSLLARASEEGCAACVTEASSQALAQGRLDGIEFDAAVFTNLTRDHLDYHGTFENYLSSKKKLFEHAATSVVNLDDPRSQDILNSAAGRRVTFSTVLDCADYTAKNISLRGSSVSFELVSRGQIFHIEFASPGLFSVSNAAAAAVCALTQGIEPETVSKALAASKSVEGRLERVECGAAFSIIIDYAHTPDGLEQILRAMRPACRGRLIVVFGCGGDRDKTKRPLMGAAACRFADIVVVTSDNPRSEEPVKIIDDILKGADRRHCRLFVEPDRRAAIALALGEARAGDTVILAGKGHEKYQLVGGKKLPFDEREIVRDLFGLSHDTGRKKQ